jgi:divalent metal cation (Fe/Co/Zn/Cd) transporter
MRPGRDGSRLAAVRETLAARFGVDTRALAAVRVAIGSILLVDLLLRVRYIEAFYTRGGVLPRAANAALYPTLSSLSLHALSGAVWLQWALFAAAAVLAVLLVVGYRTWGDDKRCHRRTLLEVLREGL